MVKAAWLGEGVATIARWSGRTPRTLRRWVGTFRVGRVAALAGAPMPGRPRTADAAYLAALEAAVETGARELDLPCDVRTSGRLSASLGEQTGVRIAPGLMRVLLHRARFANGRPKHTSFVVALLVSQSGLAPAGRVAAGLPATLLGG